MLVTLPKVVRNTDLHRLLEPVDLEIIFKGAGQWGMYYSFLHLSGLRAGDVSMLKYGNIDFEKKGIVSLIQKVRRIHEFPLAKPLIDLLDPSADPDLPIFPALYDLNERRMQDKYAKPRKHMGRGS